MIRVQYSRAGFTKEFNRMLAQTENPTGMLLAAGREAGNQLVKHFRQKDANEPNRLSPRREHFWLQVSRTVSAPRQTGYNAVSVNVSDPRIAQKVFGGRIVAKKAKELTIPESEQAYGRTAATFEQETGLRLFLVKVGGTKGNNFENAVLAAKVGGGLEVEYLLTKSVDQAADPTALPAEGVMEEAILTRCEKVLKRENE